MYPMTERRDPLVCGLQKNRWTKQEHYWDPGELWHDCKRESGRCKTNVSWDFRWDGIYPETERRRKSLFENKNVEVRENDLR